MRVLIDTKLVLTVKSNSPSSSALAIHNEIDMMNCLYTVLYDIYHKHNIEGKCLY